MKRIPAVGAIAVDAISGQIEALTDDQLRNMREAGAVQATQGRRELARDENGYILRRHARIKANNWISDRVGLKVGAEGGYLSHWSRRFGVSRSAIMRLGHLPCLMSMHKQARLLH